MKNKTIQLRISQEMYNQLKGLCIKHNMTVSQLVREVLDQLIKQERKESNDS